MTASSAAQLQGLLFSCGFGFLLAGIYDVFSVVGYLRRYSRLGAFFSDVLFCLVGALLFFLFALVTTGGAYRWFLFGGTALGFWAWRVSVSRLLFAALRVIYKPLCLLKNRISNGTEQMFGKIAKFTKKICAKMHIFFKKDLKHRG